VVAILRPSTTSTTPSPETPSDGLASAVDALIDSYRTGGNMNHVDGSVLPSRREAKALLQELLGLLFPGYFVQEQVDDPTARYFVAERATRAARALERMIASALVVPSATRGALEGEARASLARSEALGLLGALPSIREVLDMDVRAALAGDPAARSSSEVILAYPGVAAIAVHRLAHHLWGRDIPLLPRMISELIHSRTGIDIHPGARIGPSFFIDHGTGVVIGETTVIGTRVKIYQGVTLGALSVSSEQRDSGCQRHPTLEDDVTIYAGATILGGDTRIGRGSVIGGNVWLTHSVPENTTVVLDKPSLRFVPGS
jgi:serine O-acetyltransferase